VPISYLRNGNSRYCHSGNHSRSEHCMGTKSYVLCLGLRRKKGIPHLLAGRPCRWHKGSRALKDTVSRRAKPTFKKTHQCPYHYLKDSNVVRFLATAERRVTQSRCVGFMFGLAKMTMTYPSIVIFSPHLSTATCSNGSQLSRIHTLSIH